MNILATSVNTVDPRIFAPPLLNSSLNYAASVLSAHDIVANNVFSTIAPTALVLPSYGYNAGNELIGMDCCY